VEILLPMIKAVIWSHF